MLGMITDKAFVYISGRGSLVINYLNSVKQRNNFILHSP